MRSDHLRDYQRVYQRTRCKACYGKKPDGCTGAYCDACQEIMERSRRLDLAIKRHRLSPAQRVEREARIAFYRFMAEREVPLG